MMQRRFISEAFGAVINYDSKTKDISVVLVDKTGWKELDEGVFYPSDWKGEFTEDGTIHYASPQESEVWLQVTDENLSDVIANFKKEAVASGFVFIEEEPLDPNDENSGKKMLFFEYDSEGELYAAYEITVEQKEANVVVKEIYVPFEVLKPDLVIIYAIVYQ